MRASEMRTMSRTPCCNSFFGIGNCPHSGMPGAPWGPAFCSTMTLSASHVERRIVDARGHVLVVAKDHRASGVLLQPRFHRRRLDDRAIRGEVAARIDDPALDVDAD